MSKEREAGFITTKTRPLHIVPVHGEGRTLFQVVDKDAPEGEQPAIVGSFEKRDYAQRFAGSLYNFCNLSDEFRALLVTLATQSGHTTLDHAFAEYRSYSNMCDWGDMSFLNSEFVTFYNARNPKRILQAAWGDEVFAPTVKSATLENAAAQLRKARPL